MCLKSSLKNNVRFYISYNVKKVSLEGKSISGSMMGKLTVDMGSRKYVQKKKMSIDSKGVFVNETDIGNVLKNTTLMLRFLISVLFNL